MTAATEDAIAWCLRALYPTGGARLLAVEKLHGGLDAETCALTVLAENERFEVVLKQQTRADGGDGRARIQNEARVLRALEGRLSWPEIPRCLALDTQNGTTHHARLSMARVAGVANVASHQSERRIAELARALAALHVLQLADAELPPFEVDRRLEVFAREPRPAELWRQVFADVERSLDAALGTLAPALTHGDYHMGNVLFGPGGELGAVVDWAFAGLGPWAFDVGYCRMDLALLFGTRAADTFLRTYERAAGRAVPSLALWDLVASIQAFPDPARWLPAWHALGRSDLDAALVRERLNTFTRAALGRLR